MVSLTTYPLPRHHRMNNKEEIHIKEDKEIRDLLIKESIIQDPRVIRCGKWSNKEGFVRTNQYHKPYITFCGKYECRVCRRNIKEVNIIFSDNSSLATNFVINCAGGNSLDID